VFGEVERSGVLWVENLPLAGGTNYLTLTVSNAAGLASMTNLTIVKSTMTFALTQINGDLWNPTMDVSGVVSDPDTSVWVNGVLGTNHHDGAWSASGVPVSAGGVASFIYSTEPPGPGDASGSINAEKGAEIRLESGTWTDTNMVNQDFSPPYNFYEAEGAIWDWNANGGSCLAYYHWPGEYAEDDYPINADRTVPYMEETYWDDWGGWAYYVIPDPVLGWYGTGWQQDMPQHSGALSTRGGYYLNNYEKKTETCKLVLHTGGKARSGRRNLFALNSIG